MFNRFEDFKKRLKNKSNEEAFRQGQEDMAKRLANFEPWQEDLLRAALIFIPLALMATCGAYLQGAF